MNQETQNQRINGYHLSFVLFNSQMSDYDVTVVNNEKPQIIINLLKDGVN